MAALRLTCMVVALVAFFLVGTPAQWAVRRNPRLAPVIPRFFCRLLLRLAKVDLAVAGAPLAGRPCLLAANHISWIDILALGAVVPACFLAKSDVASWPLVSAFARVQGTVFVDRRRRRSIVPANRALAASMVEGRPALLFPEGTSLAGPLPARFLSSHFAAARDALAIQPALGAVMVQPVAIAYSSPDAAWVGDDTLIGHLWRTLRGPRLACRIGFGAPLSYLPTSDRKVVAAATREAVVALLAAHTASATGASTTYAAQTIEPPHPVGAAGLTLVDGAARR